LYWVTIVSLQENIINTAGSARDIVDKFTSAAGQASVVLTSAVVSGITYESGTTTLVLSLPTIDMAGDLVVGQTDTVVFYKNGNDVFEIIGLGMGSGRRPGSIKLSHTVSDLAFIYDNQLFGSVSNVMINATTTATMYGNTVQYFANGRVYLRNH
jgi:hypothetical protein